MQEGSKQKRQILLNAVAQTVKNHRLKIGKSISRISDEINVSKSIWSDIELGKSDLQFTTFWRVSEALGLQPDKLIKDIKNNLDEDISFLE